MNLSTIVDIVGIVSTNLQIIKKRILRFPQHTWQDEIFEVGFFLCQLRFRRYFCFALN